MTRAVCVEDVLYPQIAPEIHQWMEDAGATVLIPCAASLTPLTLRAILQHIPQLHGSLFVGKTPYVYLRGLNTTTHLLCDTFWMDLDGEYHFETNPRIMDRAISTPGRTCTVWHGRLWAPTTDPQWYREYFARNHALRSVVHPVERAVAFVDDEWHVVGDIGLSEHWPDPTVVEATTQRAFLDEIAQGGAWLYAVTHSGITFHQIRVGSGWEKVTSADLEATPPQFLGYTLTACHIGYFLNANYLGGRYIFAPGTRGLVALTSTATNGYLP